MHYTTQHNADRGCCTGWAKFMEWKYPISIEITNSKAFKAVGAIEAAASL